MNYPFLTQKERDVETGLDYFGARYYSSAQGRFTSPDPLLSSGRIESPQSWNRYAYVFNNPLRFFDPLGLYEFDANVDEKQRENFRRGLKQAQDDLAKVKKTYGENSDEYKYAKAAVEAYGCEQGSKGCSEAQGNNGVVVAVGAQEKGALANVTTKDGKVYVTLAPEIANSTEMSAEISHEGSHVVDTKAYNSNGTSVTDYEAEFKAFTAQSAMAEARGFSFYTGRTEPTAQHPNGMAFVLYDAGWKKADKNTVEAVRGRRNEGINKILALPKSQGGIYEVTPTNPGRSYYPPKP